MLLFFLRELMEECTCVSKGGVGYTASEAGFRLWAVSTETDMGLEVTECEIMT